MRPAIWLVGYSAYPASTLMLSIELTKHQTADALSSLMVAEENSAQIKDNVPVVVLETTSENIASIQIVPHMTTTQVKPT